MFFKERYGLLEFFGEFSLLRVVFQRDDAVVADLFQLAEKLSIIIFIRRSRHTSAIGVGDMNMTKNRGIFSNFGERFLFQFIMIEICQQEEIGKL